MTDETISSATGAASFAGGKVYKVDLSSLSKAAASIKASDVFGSDKAFATSGAASNAKGLIVAKDKDNAYAIFAVVNNNDTTITTSSEVKLIATVDAEVAASNFIFV